VKSTLWKFSKDPYEIFKLIIENPRITKKEMTKNLNVSPSSFNTWWSFAIENKFITFPFFRRRSYKNFREYFYFIKADDPHQFFKKIQENNSVTYCSIQTGFADLQVISKSEIDLKGEIVLSGHRSNYYVSIPPNCTQKQSISRIKEKVQNIEKTQAESPLKFFKKSYAPWSDMDEAIFSSFCNNLRKQFTHVMKETGAYSDKIINWFRSRDKFGDTITMFFPEGERYYQLSLYAMETRHDNTIIDIFSQLPTPSVFYRVDKFLIMAIYMSFPFEARSLVRTILSSLKRKKLVSTYTNSIVEYGYRPG
jgi:hypothetical protein